MWFKLKAISTNETCYDAIAYAGRCRSSGQCRKSGLGQGQEIVWQESWIDARAARERDPS